MERLDMNLAPQRANIEAAIHFARYAIGKGLAKDRRVLDVACGEGYGSYLLKKAGAESVVGVDISEEAVARAQVSFALEGLQYVAAKAEDLTAIFAEASFDLVMSVETIEHLAHPRAFLQALKRLVTKDGVIVLSCPNDHWYFPEAERSNPFHLRKYRMEEFQELCVSELGRDVRWSVGTGVFGFGSTPLNAAASYQKIPNSWMSYQDVGGAYLVSGESEIETTATQCGYFIGIWNAPDYVPGVAVFPLSMDGYASMVMAEERAAQAEEARVTWEGKAEAARTHEDALNTALATAKEALAAVKAELAASLDEHAAVQYGLHALLVASKEELASATESLAASKEALAVAEAEQVSVQQGLQALVAEAGAHAPADAPAASLVAELGEALKLALREQRRLGLRLSAAHAEKEAVRNALLATHADHDAALQATLVRVQELEAAHVRSQEECHHYRICHERYVRLRRVLPQPLRSWIVRVVKALRGQGTR